MNYEREQKYKDKIVELQRTIRFLHTTIDNAILAVEEEKPGYTILILKDALNDSRFIRS